MNINLIQKLIHKKSNLLAIQSKIIQRVLKLARVSKDLTESLFPYFIEYECKLEPHKFIQYLEEGDILKEYMFDANLNQLLAKSAKIKQEIKSIEQENED